jgi:hypothetical protein
MAEKGGNSGKATGDDPSVLGSLSSTRPARLSRRARADEAGAETVPRKAGPGADPAAPEAAGPPAKARASSARPKAVKPPAKPVGDSPAAKAQAAAAKAPAAKPKAVKARAKPKAVKAPARPAAESPEAQTSRPQAIRAGHPTLSEPPADHPSSTPGGVRAVKGAVRAAGGLASAGLTLGGHVLKWVFARLPRP